MNFTMTKILIGMTLTAATSGVQAIGEATTDFTIRGTLNMYSQIGLDTSGVVAGTTAPLLVPVDNTITGFVDYTAGTWGVSSTTSFFNIPWTASGGTLIRIAGTYALDTATGAINAAASCTVAGDGLMCFTVGANQLAGEIDFAWNGNNFHIVNVWDINPYGILTAAVVPGTESGPFPGLNAVFNLTVAVPEPSSYAMMLAGLGLVGFVARSRKA